MGKTIHQGEGKPQGKANHELTPSQLLVSGNYSVLPSGGGTTGKSPLVEWTRYQHETPTLEDIGIWDQEFHPKLWGVVTGVISGVVVIDVDKPERRAIFDKVGLSPHIETPRGGYHYWFTHPGYPVKTIAGIIQDVDVRGDGGFINVLGTRKDGSYKVLIPPLPDKLYPWDMLPKPIAKALAQQKQKTPPIEGGIIPDTKRNDTLIKLGGTLRAKGLSEDAIEGALQAINLESCKPPLAADEVTKIAHSAARYQPSKEIITNTDTGNAIRLRQHFGDVLRYCYEANKWLVWNGGYWEWDFGAGINQYATLTVKNIYHEAATEPDTDIAKALARHAMACESNQRILAMITRAESQLGLAIKMNDLDTDDWLLNVKNGTIDLRTGDLLPFTKEHLTTHRLDVEYHKDAECPLFMAFLDRVCANDTELILYLQKCVGISLTGDTQNELVFFIFGEGQNGKSTFLGIVRFMLGSYGHRVNPDMFMTRGKSSSGPKESLANLRGKRFVLGNEVEEGRRFAMALIKATTGAETITADRKWEHETEYQPTHKLWLFGNYKPEVRDTSVAAWRRLKLIPFEVKITDEEKDTKLKVKLRKELPGILAWAVRGCLAYQKDGITDPPVVLNATSRYRKEQDVFGIFIDECCVVEQGQSITKASFRTELKTWCIANNVDPFNNTQVLRLMSDMGIKESSDGKHRIWKGIRMRTEGDELPEDTSDVDTTDKIDKISGKSRINPVKRKIPKNLPKKTKNNVNNVKSNLEELPDGYPPYPKKPCKKCGSDLFWPGDGGWLCCTCKPRPEGD